MKNVRYVSGVKADNKLEIKFKRYLQTGDSDDYKLTEGQTLDLVWAFGFPDRLYHGTSNRGNQTILFDQTMSAAHKIVEISLELILGAMIILNFYL